jgi:seryl-tRNA synthetase
VFDIRLIREDLDKVHNGLKAKGVDMDLRKVLAEDQLRRELQIALDQLRSQKNAANDAISQCLKQKQDPQDKITAMKGIAGQIDNLEMQIRDIQQRIDEILIGIPNLADPSVPVGGKDKNLIVRQWGTPKTFNFHPQSHVEIAESLDIIDFKRAAKLTGSHFILYKGAGAKLERALYNFMLDLHTKEHGYQEVFPPFLVNTSSMTATGQLPKMQEDMYKIKDEDLYLIPTAEVPVTNIHRDEILREEELPIYYTAYTACFRREAGSYGKETKGLIRVHQFDKVELVKFVNPMTSADELENLVRNAEKVLQLLDIPYRVVMLASGDLSFAAAKCYDLEAHAAGGDVWLEVSSCSNFEAFQARRSNIRFKGKETKKPAFVHTLNGSGLALARTMVAILENYQTAAGEVMIPRVLRPYMNGMESITKNRC